MNRKIYISAINRHVSLWNYVQAIKKAKASPDSEFKHGLTTWYPIKGRDIMRQFFNGV